MNAIRDLREAKGLTQAELARRIGVQQPAIVKYENGDCSPPLARAFGWPTRWTARCRSWAGGHRRITGEERRRRHDVTGH